MAARTVELEKAGAMLSQLVRDLKRDNEVVITESGRPVARLVAPEPHRTIADTFGIAKGQMWIADDFDDDEDEMARLFGIID